VRRQWEGKLPPPPLPTAGERHKDSAGRMLPNLETRTAFLLLSTTKKLDDAMMAPSES
jgi:hypothetical protein